MGVRRLGNAALQGWRGEAADRVARAAGRRTPLDEDRIRAALGLLFLALAVRYVVRTIRDFRG